MRALPLAARLAARLLVAAGSLGLATAGVAVAGEVVAGEVAVAPSQARLEAHKVELAWLADLTTFGHPLEVVVVAEGLQVRGVVPDETVRQQALRVARQHSYLPVADALTVTSPPAASPLTGEALRQAATEHLTREFGPRASGFEVTVTAAGQVCVRGSVASVEDKVGVSKALRQVPGCQAAVNQLSVAPVLRGGQPVTLVSRDGTQAVRGSLPPSALPATASTPVPPPTPHVPTVVSAPAPVVVPASATSPAGQPLPAPGSEPAEGADLAASLPRVNYPTPAAPAAAGVAVPGSAPAAVIPPAATPTLPSGLPQMREPVGLIAASQPPGTGTIRPAALASYYPVPTGYSTPPPAPVPGTMPYRSHVSVYPGGPGCATCGGVTMAAQEPVRHGIRARITALRATVRRDQVVHQVPAGQQVYHSVPVGPVPTPGVTPAPGPGIAPPTASPVPGVMPGTAPGVAPAPSPFGASAAPAPAATPTSAPRKGVMGMSAYIKQPKPDVWPPAHRMNAAGVPAGGEQAAQPAQPATAPSPASTPVAQPAPTSANAPTLTPVSATVPRPGVEPFPTPSGKVDITRLNRLVQTAGGAQVRHVKVTLQPDRSVRVAVTVISPDVTTAVVDRLLHLPEMSAPGVRLEVEVAP